ncbi:hypothetical protein P692DRAFT_201872342 [Suillus brevipes Sb2]|nr:hypothetical protein P692DRAFT_201872342 [Suillus brevipes Sb2]
MSAPLLITGTSSVRDRDVNGRLTKPAHSASASASIVPDSKHSFFATEASLQALAPFESYRPRLRNYFLAFVCTASSSPLYIAVARILVRMINKLHSQYVSRLLRTRHTIVNVRQQQQHRPLPSPHLSLPCTLLPAPAPEPSDLSLRMGTSGMRP